MRDTKFWSAPPESGVDHCILFVDDSIAEHIDSGFEGFNCVRVLFTRGGQGDKGEDES